MRRRCVWHRRRIARLTHTTSQFGVEYDSLAHMFDTIFDQVLAYAAGTPINVQNPDALTARA